MINLMLDDWVEVVSNDHLKYVQIAEIYQNSILTKESEFESEEVSIDNIRAIPLIPKILEKNGFTKEYGVWVIYRHPSFKWFVLYKKEFGYTISVGELEVSINYVHELQLALKLCRIEKTIEL